MQLTSCVALGIIREDINLSSPALNPERYLKRSWEQQAGENEETAGEQGQPHFYCAWQ